jgi:hypothetical protein
MEVSGQLHTPAALPHEEVVPSGTQLDRRLGGSRSRVGRCGVKINLALAGIRTPAVQPLVIPAENLRSW